jgi:hypothetical protein
MTLRFEEQLTLPKLGNAEYLDFMQICKKIFDMEPKYATIEYKIPDIGTTYGEMNGKKITTVIITILVDGIPKTLTVDKKGLHADDEFKISWSRYNGLQRLLSIGAIY